VLSSVLFDFGHKLVSHKLR